MRELVEKEIKEALLKCCVTLDAWTSCATESYLGVTCHYVDNEYELRSFALDLKLLVESHSSEYIFSKIMEVLDDWEMYDKVY